MTADNSTELILQEPHLPPIYDAAGLNAEQDPHDVAVEQATAGAPAGTLLWSRRSGRISLALVLKPDQSYDKSLPVCFVAMVSLLDALGGIIPPSIAVTFSWPDRIDVNGGLAGGLRIAAAPTNSPQDVPDWMVVSILIAIRSELDDDSPGLRPDSTTLYSEGCGEVDTIEFLERFSRHFMQWINRWQDEGLESLRMTWLTRESGFGENTAIYYGGRKVAGKFVTLSEWGDAVLETEMQEKQFSLVEAYREGSWVLDDLTLT